MHTRKRRATDAHCPILSTMLYTRAVGPTILRRIIRSTILTTPLHLRCSTCYANVLTRTSRQRILPNGSYWLPNNDGYKYYAKMYEPKGNKSKQTVDTHRPGTQGRFNQRSPQKTTGQRSAPPNLIFDALYKSVRANDPHTNNRVNDPHCPASCTMPATPTFVFVLHTSLYFPTVHFCQQTKTVTNILSRYTSTNIQKRTDVKCPYAQQTQTLDQRSSLKKSGQQYYLPHFIYDALFTGSQANDPHTNNPVNFLYCPASYRMLSMLRQPSY